MDHTTRELAGDLALARTRADTWKMVEKDRELILHRSAEWQAFEEANKLRKSAEIDEATCKGQVQAAILAAYEKGETLPEGLSVVQEKEVTFDQQQVEPFCWKELPQVLVFDCRLFTKFVLSAPDALIKNLAIPSLVIRKVPRPRIASDLSSFLPLPGRPDPPLEEVD